MDEIKVKFVLKIRKDIPENPSYNDVLLWAISRKSITISQKDYASLSPEIQGLFEIVKK